MNNSNLTARDKVTILSALSFLLGANGNSAGLSLREDTKEELIAVKNKLLEEFLEND